MNDKNIFDHVYSEGNKRVNESAVTKIVKIDASQFIDGEVYEFAEQYADRYELVSHKIVSINPKGVITLQIELVKESFDESKKK